MTYVTYYPVTETSNTDYCVDSDWIPAYDIIEHDNNFVLEFDLPGFEKSDFAINIKDGVLTVSGERKEHKVEENYFNYHGRPYGSFERSFRLSDLVIEDKMKAIYKNGVLRLELPKREDAKPRTIEIE